MPRLLTCPTDRPLLLALQKVVEGERAQRSEVQRQLREVETALAALKNPEWWPGHMVRCVASAASVTPGASPWKLLFAAIRHV